MKNISLIVIDPQAGFCSPSGSLALKYGINEISEIQNVIPNIQEALRRSRRRHLVKSEYSIAQFTNGNIDSKLAHLCVPSENNDCDIVSELPLSEFHTCIVKHEKSALSSIEFLKEIENCNPPEK